jgi:RNA polymerase sigma-70 factor, ECF subfamily
MVSSATQVAVPPPLVALLADVNAFRSWYEEVLPRVYRYLYARTGGDGPIAEELTQATMIAAVRGAAGFDGRAAPTTWVLAIARHQLVDHYRRTAREHRRQARLVAAYADPAEAAWHRSTTRAAISEVLLQLSPDQRAALVCRYLDGLSVADTAAALGRSLSATEALLMRAKAAFRSAYPGSAND